MAAVDEPRTENNGISMAALVLGIVGLILSFIPFISFASWILGTFSVICGVIGRKESQKEGIATAGLIFGLATIAWKLAAAVAAVWVLI